MNGQWAWLIGRKFSLGVVTDVLGETATVLRGDDTTRILVMAATEFEHIRRQQ